MNNSLKLVLLIAISSLVSNCQSQPTAKHKELDGAWLVELNSADIGLARTVMNFDYGDSTFTACTRKNADRDLLGFWRSTLGRWFTSDFKHGALLNITDGKWQQHGDTLLLKGIFRSAMGNYYFRAAVHHDVLSAKLLTAKQVVKATLNGKKQQPKQPLSNYPELVQRTLQLTREHIYNPSVFGSSEWKSFESHIQQLSKKVQDDVEMEFAFYYLAGKLPFSHYALMRQPAGAEEHGAMPAKQVLLEEKQPGTFYMNIKSFGGSAAEMDSAFVMLSDRRCENLIVDLRENPGGNVEPGMSFVRHLADSAFYGGVFLTQQWFASHSAPPAVSDYKQFPEFTEKNYDLLINGIHNQKGLCLKIVPEAPVYRGRLYILTSGVTASTCEPLVYGLKQRNRATLVGATTAGAMLNGEFFAVADGFSLFLPTADYYAADGYHPDKKGVSPNIAVEPAQALNYVMEHFINK